MYFNKSIKINKLYRIYEWLLMVMNGYVWSRMGKPFRSDSLRKAIIVYKTNSYFHAKSRNDVCDVDLSVERIFAFVNFSKTFFHIEDLPSDINSMIFLTFELVPYIPRPFHQLKEAFRRIPLPSSDQNFLSLIPGLHLTLSDYRKNVLSFCH